MNNIIEQIRLAENLFFSDNKIDSLDISPKFRAELESYYENKNARLSEGFQQEMYMLFFCFSLVKKHITKRKRVFIKVKRLLAVADILYSLDARKSSIALYTKCLTLSKRHKFDWAILRCARVLYPHYSYYQQNLKKGEKFFKLYSLTKCRIDFEVECEHEVVQLIYHFSRSKELTKRIKEKASSAYSKLAIVTDDQRTFIFNRWFLYLSLMYFEAINDIKSLVHFLESHIQKLLASSLELENDKNLTYKYLCEYYLRTEKFDLFVESLESGLKIPRKYSPSWFRYKELESLYFLRIKKWNDAYDLLNQLVDHKFFSSVSQIQQQRIVLKQGYASIVMLLLSLGDSKVLKALEKQIELIESISEYSSDKKAMNISLIILQLLVSIWKKDLDLLEIRVEAVDKYLRRYTRSSPLFRSHSFIKILLTFRRYNFVQIGAERNYRKYLKHLTSLPYATSPHPGEIELVYYEDLVGIVESYLNDRQLKMG